MGDNAVSPLARLSEAWARFRGTNTRHGVVGNWGRVERLGFYSERAAQQWAWRAKLRNYELFWYDARERALPALHHQRDRL